MADTEHIIDLDQIDHSKFSDWPYSQDFCITCGLCASSCPASGIDSFDPRKLVRMVALGLVDEIKFGAGDIGTLGRVVGIGL